MAIYTCKFFTPEYKGKGIPGIEYLGVFYMEDKPSTVFPMPDTRKTKSRLEEYAKRIEFVEERASKEVYLPHRQALHLFAAKLIGYQMYLMDASEQGNDHPLTFEMWVELQD